MDCGVLRQARMSDKLAFIFSVTFLKYFELDRLSDVEVVLKALQCFKYIFPFFSPQNLIAQSQSGTGKTAAFVLAMLSHVDPSRKYPQVGFHLSPLRTFAVLLW